ncbi:TIR domain-containing protein [Kribbella sp. NBC_00382]|uniref:TIR domain-containing protein n=1 Tax=Kribbella sp. NBC_00382 TaxID=2975967 RepID=UPI002E216E5B
MVTESTGWDFFVSYTQADRVWAEWIAWVLEENSYSVLVQAWDFVPGSNWTQSMVKGVAEAELTIAVLSEAYLGSVYGRDEWLAAWAQQPVSEQRKLLPVRVSDCDLPGLLGNVTGFDLFGLDEAKARARLLEMTAAATEGKRKPTGRPRFPDQGRAMQKRARFPGDLPSTLKVPARHANFTGRTALARDLERRMLLWLDAQEGNSVNPSTLEPFVQLASTKDGGEYSERQVRLAAEYLYENRLIDAIRVDQEHNGWIRPTLTASGKTCVTDFGADVAEYLIRGQARPVETNLPSASHSSVGDSQVNLSIASDTAKFREVGRLREQAGDLHDAQVYYQRAADSGDTAALRDLARLREQAGDSVSAQTYYQQAVDAGDTAALRDLAPSSRRPSGADELAETASDDIVSSSRPSLLPGAMADTVPEPGDGRVKGADKLGAASDVEMLVSVLLARDTPLPLAVGLFGDWGSGKSFFMALMQERIDELASLAKAGRPDAWPYCKEVRQVRFNAWHYVDTDLWASLAATLFDELARAGRPDETTAKLNDLDQAREKVARTRSERQRLEREVSDLEISVNRPIAATRAALTVALRAVRSEGKIPGKLRDVAEHGAEVADDPTMQLADTLGAVDQAVGKAQVAWRLFKEEVLYQNRRATLATFVVLAVLAVAGAKFIQWPPVVTVLAFVSAVIVGLTPALSATVRVLYWAREARKTRQLPLIQKRAELADAQAAEKAAKHEASLGEQELADARNKGHQLQKLVRERAASSDYRDRLGVMSRVRRDFEDLVSLMPSARPRGQQHQAEAADLSTTSGNEVPDVDRIFLYVDDLDRCPHDKVVEVLQAVHLLLAFELFVVVVGVDNRWLTKSVAAHYDNLLDASDSYLEKIFQIPFALGPMTRRRYQDLIIALTPPPSPDTEAARATGVPGSPAPEVLSNVDGDQLGTGAHPATTEASVGAGGSTEPTDPAAIEATPPRPESLSITKPEQDLLGKVNDLVPTPRAAKRLVNIYRMLRVSVPDSEIQAFLPQEDPEVKGGNEYQAAILLLSILIGRPAAAQNLFKELTISPSDRDIWQLLDTIPGLEQTSQLARDYVTVTRIDAYRRWAPRVSRFSFRMSSESTSSSEDQRTK